MTIRLVNHLRQLAGLQAAGEMPDQQLLERFVAARDEEAFAALVRRHGPMVAGVCRRLVGETDAEDAYQATFFVLARKAASIHKRESIGSWLHGVAMRVAGKARIRAARRALGERGRPVPVAAAAGDDITWGELRSVLDEELAKLSLPGELP
jgi:DNA-directed RNA polymerase specialized sigma24 family protein